MNEEKTYQEEYNDFWKDIVENEDGTLNKDQVMRELSDYSMVMDNCARAFYTMTNGRISKQNTKFFEVENIFNDLYTDTETYYEDMAEKDKEIERLKEEYIMLQNASDEVEEEKDREIERQKEIIRQLDIKNLELTTIIKEVREYIEQKEISIFYQELGLLPINVKNKVLEILDKVDKDV